MKNVPIETLPPLLIELSYTYYDQLEVPKSSESTDVKAMAYKKQFRKYQCESCLTVYDEK